ncbi:MAG: helix-turn-helix domain-containing protein [Planctomycetota bacterium]
MLTDELVTRVEKLLTDAPELSGSLDDVLKARAYALVFAKTPFDEALYSSLAITFGEALRAFVQEDALALPGDGFAIILPDTRLNPQDEALLKSVTHSSLISDAARAILSGETISDVFKGNVFSKQQIQRGVLLHAEFSELSSVEREKFFESMLQASEDSFDTSLAEATLPALDGISSEIIAKLSSFLLRSTPAERVEGVIKFANLDEEKRKHLHASTGTREARPGLAIVTEAPHDIVESRVSTAEAAEILGRSESRIRQLVRDQELESKKVGRDHTFLLSDIMRLKENPRPKGRPRKNSD